MKTFFLSLLLTFSASVNAFAPASRSKCDGSLSPTALNGVKVEKKAAASLLAAAFLATNCMAVAPAFAAPEFSAGTTEIIAGRSGGRSGGRASSRSYAAPRRSSPTNVQRTTVIRQPVVSGPSVIVAPSMGYGYGFGYNPFGGFGLGYGLGAVNGVGNAMRDVRQEGEIQRTKEELQQSQMREAEMEARLRQLEMRQAVQQAGQ
mmetsp:Transcript_10250/g.14710  ORF Transcript_10250/g.14710 Transcript_10250/m.14710 type:complete len:204 (-) Transcript_10250:83-694(-)